MSRLDIFSIRDEDKNPIVVGLLGVLKERDVEIQKLKEEIARLKNHPQKPRLRPSIISKKDKSIRNKKKNRSGDSSNKSTSKKQIDIHRIIRLKPENIPEGSKLIKSRPYVVQNLIIKARNTRYIREIWQTSEGKYLRASLPDSVHGHYGNRLRAYILDLYYGAHTSQNTIAEQLSDIGIYISTGQINRILTEGHDRFHQEAENVLETGLRHASYISVDDTGLRHKGRNGYSTHIGNEFFAYFKKLGVRAQGAKVALIS